MIRIPRWLKILFAAALIAALSGFVFQKDIIRFVNRDSIEFAAFDAIRENTTVQSSFSFSAGPFLGQEETDLHGRALLSGSLIKAGDRMSVAFVEEPYGFVLDGSNATATLTLPTKNFKCDYISPFTFKKGDGGVTTIEIWKTCDGKTLKAVFELKIPPK